MFVQKVYDFLKFNRSYQNIVGIKIRSGINGSCDFPGLKPVFITKKAAEEVGKPLMVHIGHGLPTTSVLPPVLRKGDFLTHAFRGDPNSLLDDSGKIIPELTDARQRGEVLDMGHGAENFSFDTANAAIISTFEVVVVVVLAFLILEGTITLHKILGACLVIGAVIILAKSEYRTARAQIRYLCF